MRRTDTPHPPRTHHSADCCLPAQPFDKLSYLYGQVLTPAQLRRAQDSVYEKIKLHTRCFEGWGVGCGLEVFPVPMPQDPCAPDCPPPSTQPPPPATGSTPPATTPGTPGTPVAATPAAAPPPAPVAEMRIAVPPPVYPKDPCNIPPTRVRVDCGFAVDCEGNDMVVRTPLEIDLYALLSHDERRQVEDGQLHTLWVSLCFKQFGWEPIRAVMGDGCSIGCEGSHAFEREGVCLKVSLHPPHKDERCETCCDCCEEACVLLARVDGYRRGVSVGTVDNEVRRPLTRYVPTTVTAVNWFHGSHYKCHEVDELLYKHGLHVRLSRPVHADTLIAGVFDVYVYELGSGRSGTVRVLQGHIDHPHHSMVDHFTYRLPHRERIDPGDRVMIVFRADHVLDRCCQPVDGNHVGGLVPAIAGSLAPSHPRNAVECRSTRTWTSGNRSPGGTFESWVTASEHHEHHEGGEGRTE